MRAKAVFLVGLALFFACMSAYGQEERINSDAWKPDLKPYLYAQAQTEETQGSKPSEQTEGKQPSMEEISKQINNPLADLWSLVFQNDYSLYEGEITDEHREINVTLFQPVLSIPIGEKLNLLNRPIFSYISAELPKPPTGFDPKNLEEIPLSGGPSIGTLSQFLDWDRDTSFGDFIFLSMLGPATKEGFLWGGGLTTMWPTASDDTLGSEKYSAGPAAVAVYMGKKWTIGLFGQHWWSYAGDDDRSDVNKTNIQYFIKYALPNHWSIGMAPNITANWESDSDDRWTIPVGLGVSKMVKFGKLPVKIGFEVQYAVVQPDIFGMDWNFRFTFTPVIPNLVKMKMKK